MKRFIAILAFLVPLQASVSAPVPCNTKNFKLSRLDIDPNDTDYLKVIMGHSYGGEVEKFIPKLLSVNSSVYYKGSKTKPQITFFSTTYKEDKDARQAYEHLRHKWLNDPRDPYDVMRVKNEVIWFANNRLPIECFFKFVTEEKAKIARK